MAKQTPAQRRASLRNLAKARRARRKGGKKRRSRPKTRKRSVRTRARDRGRKVGAFARKKGIGGLARSMRLGVAFLGTAVNRFARMGLNTKAAEETIVRYSGIRLGLGGPPGFELSAVQPQAEGFVTALADDFVKRRYTGHYRRMSGKHILPNLAEGAVVLDSIWCGEAEGTPSAGGDGNFLPTEVDWVSALDCYQDSVSGYSPDAGTYDFDRRFKKQFTITTVADAISWLAGRTGINAKLPKGVNL